MKKLKHCIGHVVRKVLHCKHKVMGVEIGDCCFISAGAWLDNRSGKVIIGNHVSITKGAKILSHDATSWRLKKDKPEPEKVVTRLDDHVFIGMNAVVLAGVHIRENSVIGAGAVVSKDVPPNCVVVGNPMKIIKKYDMTTGEWRSVSDPVLQMVRSA